MDRVDRIQLVVASADDAAETFNALLGTEVVNRKSSVYLGANRTILAMGESEVELCEPDGSGIAADFLSERGEGLLSAGLCCATPGRLKERIGSLGFEVVEDGDQFYLPGDQHYGIAFVISKTRPRNRIGPISFLFEVTNTLVSDWRMAATHYAGIFGLNPRRFCPISSELFGYDGTLTMFNPPDRLDRLELSQVVRDDVHMARWTQMFGDSLYMASCETHDLENVISRFMEAGVLWTPRGPSKEDERDAFWTHPRDLHGLLMGISRTTTPWDFSGRPDVVDPPIQR
ncbi:MAG: hypothetical protein QF515_08765 [Pseudomonadales bacterium]|nr:hypothetical protein [Pseudomonadales bacterium]